MEPCKYKVGQIWRTRRGDDVEIVRVNDLNGPYPVIGRMNKENWERSWTKDGKFAAGAEEIPRGGDLVELLKDAPEKEQISPKIGDVWLTRSEHHAINPPAAQESIADEAKRIVAGVRRKQYGGTPERSFTAIADFWTALFKAKGRPEMVFTAEDVSPMMRLLKEARLCSSPDHRDSMVDIIGYTLTDAELRGIETPPAPEV